MPSPSKRRSGPDREAALAQYRRRAGVYDLELALFEPVRRRAVAWLAPRPGDTVLDVGCGTGLSFELLQSAVGKEGRIIGIEQSPEMIDLARHRAERQGWHNVTLLCAPVAHAAKPCEELALEIAAKLDAKGVKDYSLEIVPNELAQGETVVGSCEGGTRKITYARVKPNKPEPPPPPKN